MSEAQKSSSHIVPLRSLRSEHAERLRAEATHWKNTRTNMREAGMQISESGYQQLIEALEFGAEALDLALARETREEEKALSRSDQSGNSGRLTNAATTEADRG